ncbi:L,D-transpeptidase family protein [Labrys neptuniae]
MTAHFKLMRKIAMTVPVLLLAAACSNQNSASIRSTSPVPQALLAEMQAKGMTRSAPILVRIYKKESELELWKQTSSGRYALLKSYPICRWSGQLGPKKTEGDRQVPEGFYSVSMSSMNPNSKYYLSYDIGFPNAYDRSLGRDGGNIMVHGSCSSRGCYAMTDNQVAEIYAVAREALQGGQASFQVQSLPFRMTPENMARNRRNPNIGFWQNLKEGTDNFEVTKQTVKVDVCKGRYVFNGEGGAACNIPSANQSVAAAVAEKKRGDDAKIASLISSGTKAVNYIYQDGGSNPIFVARAVDQSAVPGKDRPFSYSRVDVTEVALNDAGAPATDADADAAHRVTYAAAESLMMSEAAVARKPIKGPVDSKLVTKRQETVYAGLMGAKMPAPVPVKPVVLAATPAPASLSAPSSQLVATAAPEGQPFYARWLGYAPAEQPAPQAVAIKVDPIQTGTVPTVKIKDAKPKTVTAKTLTPKTLTPGKPMMASTALPASQMAELPPAITNPPAEQPFYKRWLGLGGGQSTATN